MKSETALDSVVFQLTPTRTRCELVIKANGKAEKIASGLLNPFLSHLETAKNQIAKGGYSITLEPDPGADTPWFTKGTVERFVRFVSTPEVLERVNTVELEIIQMEEAIAMQGNEILHSRSVEEDLSKSTEYAGGSKSAIDADATGKAIVLYKPGTLTSDSSGEKTASREENSKVQLLRVLETRKTVLQKEQGMAFARAMAAGFTVENIAHLISFAECFGAARLLEACSKFMALYHGKHETGQWFEIDAADAMSLRSDFAAMNISGITLSADTSQQRDPINEPNDASHGKINGGDINPDIPRDMRMNGDPKMPGVPNEYFQGQYAHPMFHQWPVHSPPGMPVYQPYPMQGMPFYPNYPPPPYFAPPYAPSEASTHRKPKKTKPKKRSSESKSTAAEESEPNEASTLSPDDVEDDDDDNEGKSDASDTEEEISPKKGSRRKSGRCAGKKPGMVVIKNLNYIASKKHKDDESSAASDDSESRRSSKHSKAKGDSRGIRVETNGEDSLSNREEAAAFGQGLLDSGNWQVFQSFLLRDEEEEKEKGGAMAAADASMFSGEKKPAARRRPQGETGEDPLLSLDRDFEESIDRKMADDLDARSSAARMYKPKSVNDDNFRRPDGGFSRYGNQDVPFEEIEGGGRGGGYRRGTREEFFVYGGDEQFSNARNSSDPIAENEFDLPAPIPMASVNGSSSSYDNVIGDESFIVPVRSGSPEQNESAGRSAVVLDSEFPAVSSSTTTQELDSSNAVVKPQLNYEPEDLSLMMPEREEDRDFAFLGGGYDPALDYEMEAQAEISDAVAENGQVDESPAGTKEETKPEEKEKKPRAAAQKKADPGMGRGRFQKLNPLAQAQARADKLRAYKADLQKAKKEKEEEAIRRLEALKMERQKRIAARSSGASQSPSTQQRKTSQAHASMNPSSIQRGSKFSDSPGSPSLLQRRLPLRASPMGSSTAVSRSVSSLSNLKKDAHAAGVTRSVSSLADSKKAAAPPPPRPKVNDAVTLKKSNGTRSLTSISSVVAEDSRPKGRDGDDRRESKSTEGGEKKVERPGSGDENAVVEKIVVMLEQESPPVRAPKAQEKVEPEEAVKPENGGPAECETLSGYAAIRAAPPPPIVKCEVNNDASEQVVAFSSLLNQPAAKSLEVSVDCAPPNRPRQPTLEPLIRYENPSEKAPTHSGESSEQEPAEKPRGRESLKGFKKLLKFGRKSHGSSSADPALDSDDQSSSADQVGSPTDSISQGEEAKAVGGTTPLKSGDKSGSRHFSILSPFRSKNSENKSLPA